MIWRVIISVANYGLLALFDIAWAAIQPLFYATPIEYGGLGMSPVTIGIVLGGLGFSNGMFQGLFFARLVKKLGIKRLFMIAMSMFTIIFALFPVINLAARSAGSLTPFVWSLVCLQMFIVLVMDTAYGEDTLPAILMVPHVLIHLLTFRLYIPLHHIFRSEQTRPRCY